MVTLECPPFPLPLPSSRPPHPSLPSSSSSSSSFFEAHLLVRLDSSRCSLQCAHVPRVLAGQQVEAQVLADGRDKLAGALTLMDGGEALGGEEGGNGQLGRQGGGEGATGECSREGGTRFRNTTSSSSLIEVHWKSHHPRVLFTGEETEVRK